MAYRAAYVWNGSSFDTFGAQIVSSLEDYVLRSPVIVDSQISLNYATLDIQQANNFFIATSPINNFTVNLLNVSSLNNKIIEINIFVTQGVTGRIPSGLEVGGVAQTIKWQGGTPPTPTSSFSNKIDIFTFTLLRMSNSWVVFGKSQLNF